MILFASISTAEGAGGSIDPSLQVLQQTSKAFAKIAKQAFPSVVSIIIEQSPKEAGGTGRREIEIDPFTDDFLRFFFESPGLRNYQDKQVISAYGSGFILDAVGHIVTNQHVVKDATKITVKLQDGRDFEAKTIGIDSKTDIAIIKIQATGLQPLKLGNSDLVEVGEWALAVGNPFGLSQTLTAGIVSAVGRNYVGIADYENFIQTDAAINPGNSGGALLNLQGEAIGMNTAIYSKSGGYMGIGFAIPANTIRNVSTQLMNKGSVSRGYVGIKIQPFTPELAKSFNLAPDIKGILIAEVESKSPAEKIGLQQGDIIIEFDGKKISDSILFRNLVVQSQPNTEHNMVILREGKAKSFTIKIGLLKAEEEDNSKQEISGALEQIGISVQNLSRELADQYEVPMEKAVMVVNVQRNSMAYRLGIRRGALILEVNQQKTRNIKEFSAAINNAKKKGVVAILLRDHLGMRYVSFKLN